MAEEAKRAGSELGREGKGRELPRRSLHGQSDNDRKALCPSFSRPFGLWRSPLAPDVVGALVLKRPVVDGARYNPSVTQSPYTRPRIQASDQCSNAICGLPGETISTRLETMVAAPAMVGMLTW